VVIVQSPTFRPFVMHNHQRLSNTSSLTRNPEANHNCITATITCLLMEFLLLVKKKNLLIDGIEDGSSERTGLLCVANKFSFKSF
jgi:hypothetical protein